MEEALAETCRVERDVAVKQKKVKHGGCAGGGGAFSFRSARLSPCGLEKSKNEKLPRLRFLRRFLSLTEDQAILLLGHSTLPTRENKMLSISLAELSRGRKRP